MSDSATIFITEGKNEESKEEGVYLYAHSAGSELARMVRKALSRKQRWDDPPYLARIIFCEMVKGYEDQESGFGISALQWDSAKPIIVVDSENREISFCNPRKFDQWAFQESVIKRWSFDNYIVCSNEEIKHYWEKS